MRADKRDRLGQERDRNGEELHRIAYQQDEGQVGDGFSSETGSITPASHAIRQRGFAR